jgi:hypothetical protein
MRVLALLIRPTLLQMICVSSTSRSSSRTCRPLMRGCSNAEDRLLCAMVPSICPRALVALQRSSFATQKDISLNCSRLLHHRTDHLETEYVTRLPLSRDFFCSA